jgi:hypothetical protein
MLATLFEIFVPPWNGMRKHVPLTVFTAVHKSLPLQEWRRKYPCIVRFMVWYGFWKLALSVAGWGDMHNITASERGLGLRWYRELETTSGGISYVDGLIDSVSLLYAFYRILCAFTYATAMHLRKWPLFITDLCIQVWRHVIETVWSMSFSYKHLLSVPLYSSFTPTLYFMI